MIRRCFHRAILALLLVAGLLSAQGEEAGTEAIFRIGFGSRAMGMGRAFTGVGGDNSAIYYNPAGLDLIERMNVNVFYSTLILDASYSFASFAYPTVDLGTFAVAIGALSPGADYHITSRRSMVPIGYGNMGSYRAYLSYGKQILDEIYIGGTFKSDYQSADDNGTNETIVTRTGYAFGADFGILYRNMDTPFIGSFQAGLNVINAVPTQRKLGEGTDALPTTYRLGLAKPIQLNEDSELMVATDMVMVSAGPFQYNLGLEYRYRDFGAIRLGLDEGSIAGGFGIQWRGIGFDYAYGGNDTDGEFGAQHRLTLSYHFGLSKSEKRELARSSSAARDSLMVEQALTEELRLRIERGLEKGKAYMDSADWLNATTEFSGVMSIDPFNREARALFNEADTQLQEELRRQREQFAKLQADSAVARRDQEYIDYRFARGREFLENNQYLEALFEFNAALERDPANEVIIDARRVAQMRLDDEVDRLIVAGRREFRLGNYSEALRLLSEARVLLSEDSRLLGEIDQLQRRIQVQGDLNKGLQALEAGDYALAAEIFRRARETDPGNVDIQRYLKRADSKANARKVVLDPEDEKEYLRGVDEFLKGNIEEAIGVWEKLLEKYPYSKRLIEAVETAEQRRKRAQASSQR
jgi:tetratricopeptide (TPR) repeat protein